MSLKSIFATTATLVFASTAAFAEGTGSQGYFTIYNNTAGNILVSFYTNDGSGWSSNWLTVDALGPGESAEAQFSAATGSCAQHFSTGWLGGDGSEVIDDPISIDICEASNVYLDDNEIYYD